MLSVLLLLNLYYCKAEWIKISQIPTSDFQMYTTESSIAFSDQLEDASPIKYEDLEHIIGPGFEHELENFYQRHKEQMIKKGNDEQKPAAQRYDDPWDMYDKPLHIGVVEEPINVVVNNDGQAEEAPILNDKHRYEEYEEEEVIDAMSVENYENVTVKPVPEIFQLKFVKVKPKTSDSYSFSGFLNFLRDIQTSFVSKTARSIKDKIRTLEQFRDDLLMNIEERIKSLWPTTTVVRSKRGIIDSHHGGGMEFPSSEGALMTISFLTFAVFLIKLVLQVINTIKSKHYSYNSFGATNTGGTMAAVNIIKRNRNARKLSLSPDDLNGMKNIFSSIDNVGKI